MKRTAFAEEPQTTIIVLGGTPGQAYEASGWELWAPVHRLYEAGEYGEAADRARWSRPTRNIPPCSTTWPAVRVARGAQRPRSSISPLLSRHGPVEQCEQLGEVPLGSSLVVGSGIGHRVAVRRTLVEL